MGTKNNPGLYDCHDKADPDEPLFTLRAKDPLAPMLVRLWALRAQKAGAEPEKVAEAKACADAMVAWREARETHRADKLSLIAWRLADYLSHLGIDLPPDVQASIDEATLKGWIPQAELERAVETQSLCEVCGLPQMDTQSGLICENSHGGVGSVAPADPPWLRGIGDGPIWVPIGYGCPKCAEYRNIYISNCTKPGDDVTRLYCHSCKTDYSVSF